MLLLCYGTYFSGKARSFNSEWFQQYLWLKYSIKKMLVIAACLAQQVLVPVGLKKLLLPQGFVNGRF